jgi:hypothetical protein
MRIRALFAALALVLLGLIIPSPVSAIAPPTGNPTNCTATAQLRNLGDRTCFDKSAGTITIYSSGTGVFASFPASGATSCSPFIATPGEWVTNTYGQTWVLPANGYCANGLVTVDASGGPAAPTYVINVASSSNHDLLEWFAAGNTHEFVIVS